MAFYFIVVIEESMYVAHFISRFLLYSFSSSALMFCILSSSPLSSFFSSSAVLFLFFFFLCIIGKIGSTITASPTESINS